MRNLIPRVGLLLVAISALLISCDKEDVLQSCQVNKVRVDFFPEFNDSGESWDLLEGDPDIYGVIKHGSQTVYTSEIYEDAQNINSYNFVEGLPELLESPDDVYTVVLYDDDFPEAADLIGEFDFRPAEFQHADKIVLESSTSDVKFTLFVDWNYTEK